MNLDQFCDINKIDLSISFLKDRKCKSNQEGNGIYSGVMVEVIAVCRLTRERILYRYDKYPRRDDDLLLELKGIVRVRKIKHILSR